MSGNEDSPRQNKLNPPIVPRDLVLQFVRGLGGMTTSLHQGQGQAQCSIPHDLLKTSHNYTVPNDFPQPLRKNPSFMDIRRIKNSGSPVKATDTNPSPLIKSTHWLLRAARRDYAPPPAWMIRLAATAS